VLVIYFKSEDRDSVVRPMPYLRVYRVYPAHGSASLRPDRSHSSLTGHILARMLISSCSVKMGLRAIRVTTQVSLSRALEFGDEPFWVCGEGVEHIPTLFFRR
jgi:hypothetical protein